MWIFVGMLLGSMVTSTHDSEEACQGRKFVLEKEHVVGQCTKAPQPLPAYSTGIPVLCTIFNSRGECVR